MNLFKRLTALTYRAVRASERLTKTDMVYLVKNGSWLTGAQGLSSLASLATSIAFANWLNPELYGQYRYALSLFSLLAIPTLTGINTSLMKSAAQGYDGSLILAAKHRFLTGLLGTVIGSGAALYYASRGNHTLAASVLLIACVAPFFYAAETYAAFLNGKKLFRESSRFSFVTTLIPTLCLLLALLGTNRVSLLLASYLIPYTITRIVFFFITKNRFASSAAADPGTVAYGRHLSLIDVITTIADNLDKLLLWQFLGGAYVAQLTLAQAPVKHLSGLVANIRPLIFPKIAERDIPYLKRVLWQKTLKLFLFVGTIVGAYILLAPMLFNLLFPKYPDAVRASQYFALTFLFYPQIFLTTVFSAHAKLKEKYILSLTGSLVKIIALTILVPKYGIMGAIIAYTVVKATSFLTTLVLFIRLRP